MTTTHESLFQPCITVCDDGTIDIDWSDSYVSTSVIGESGLVEDVLYTEPEGCPHSEWLDNLVIDGVTTAGGLRKLADYIEAASLFDEPEGWDGSSPLS